MIRPTPRIWAGLFVAVALATLAAAAAAYLAVDPDKAPVASPLVLAIGQSRSAEAALARTPADLALATEATERALAQAPYDSRARLRLAFIDSLDGDLSPQGLAALEMSYQLLPFDQYVSAWRVRFALNHWGVLTPELRKKVEAEAFAFAATPRRREMLAVLESVTSPVGVVPAAFWSKRIRREHAQRVAARRLDSALPQEEAAEAQSTRENAP